MSVLFKPGDFFFFALLIGVTAFSFQWLFSQDEPVTSAVLEVEGEVLYRFDLRRQGEIAIDALPGVDFSVGQGSIRIKHNTCQRQICVKGGAIASPGESIICVPQKILLYIPANERSKAPVKIITG